MPGSERGRERTRGERRGRKKRGWTREGVGKEEHWLTLAVYNFRQTWKYGSDVHLMLTSPESSQVRMTPNPLCLQFSRSFSSPSHKTPLSRTGTPGGAGNVLSSSAAPGVKGNVAVSKGRNSYWKVKLLHP